MFYSIVLRLETIYRDVLQIVEICILGVQMKMAALVLGIFIYYSLKKFSASTSIMLVAVLISKLRLYSYIISLTRGTYMVRSLEVLNSPSFKLPVCI